MDKFLKALSVIKSKAVLAWNWGWPKIKCVWEDHRAGRMLQWAVLSLALYGLVMLSVWPLVLQAALTKGANVNAGAFLGYWVDRTLFNSFDAKFDATPGEISDVAKAARIASRGVLVAACIIGLSLGVGA